MILKCADHGAAINYSRRSDRSRILGHYTAPKIAYNCELLSRLIDSDQFQEKKPDVLIVFLATLFFSMHYIQSNS